jgi:hypothetical protein
MSFACFVVIARARRFVMEQFTNERWHFLPQRHVLFTSWNYLSRNADLL